MRLGVVAADVLGGRGDELDAIAALVAAGQRQGEQRQGHDPAQYASQRVKPRPSVLRQPMEPFLRFARYGRAMDTETHPMMMVEARRSERVRSLLRARILFNNRSSTIDCTIKNISAHGAKIEIAHSMSVPTEFDLEVPQRGRTYRARMMWRAASSMGVEFNESAGALSANAQAAIEQLEAENRKLRASIALLTKRLEDLGQVITFT